MPFHSPYLLISRVILPKWKAGKKLWTTEPEEFESSHLLQPRTLAMSPLQPLEYDSKISSVFY